MKCEYCSKELKNKGGYVRHIKTCKKVQKIKSEVIKLYTEDSLNIGKLSKRYNIGKNAIIKILGDEKRTSSESAKIAHKLYPEKYKHSEESKQKMRIKRLEYMRKNPEKTAWRKSNISYPEKIFLKEIIKLGWNKNHLIVREYSFFPYFIDFAFINEKVAVEIDGSQHLLNERKDSDKRKDDLLIEKGWRIIRIKAKDINLNLDESISKIKEFISSDVKYKNVGIIEYKNYKEKKCECGEQILNTSDKCQKCNNINQRKVERPPYEQLLEEINELGYIGTGRKYSVSDNAIRKWKKYYEKN